MQSTPKSNRLHIGIFGRRNVGKSTLINALSNQEAAIVSEIPGTTTDPVYRPMEIHEIGPIVLIDTGGIDDEGDLGQRRVNKTYQVLDKTDLSLLMVEKKAGIGEFEEKFLEEIRKRKIPLLVVINKIDIAGGNGLLTRKLRKSGLISVEVSALKKFGLAELREKLRALIPGDFERKVILSDLLLPSDLVLMVAPLDVEAPKGRLKLPQVQTIRDVLDYNCSAIIVKETELEKVLGALKEEPKLVITESHIFDKVKNILPLNIPLTSFSILYARYKGDLKTLVAGAREVDKLKKGANLLICEACTHHPIGDDIGRVVIPRMLNSRFLGQDMNFKIDYAVGVDFPDKLDGYELIIHCGACMFNRREMMHRLSVARKNKIPITNYGVLLAHLNGILDRAILPFHLDAENLTLLVDGARG